MAAAGAYVVDCDSHIMEPPTLWEEYLEERYKDRAIRIVEEHGVEKLIIGGNVMLEGRLAGLGGAHLDRSEIFAGTLRYRDGCPPASYDPGERVKLLDAWHVDCAVLFPTIGILPFPVHDPGLANAYCRAYNSWQIDFSRDIRTRVAPIATVNWHDLPTARRELERCFAAGFHGVFVPPEIIAGTRPGETHFDPIWALCEEAGLPACLHVIVRFAGAAVPFAEWQATSPGATFAFGLGATGQIIPALASLITDGLFDRFPRLKVVSVEAGCGFAAYLMDRLDEKHRFFSTLSALELKPSEYIRRNCYFVAEPDERSVESMQQLVGADRIMWGSDYPHIDSSVDAARTIFSMSDSLADVARNALLGDVARQVFRLSAGTAL